MYSAISRSCNYSAQTWDSENAISRLHKFSRLHGTHIYRSVPQICPHFATLALVQSVEGGGGGYTQGATFSLAITPSLGRDVFSGSVDAGFVLVLPFHHRNLEPDCVGVSTRGRGEVGAERRMRGGELVPTLAVGWRASASRGEKAGCFCEVAGVSIVATGGPHSQ